MTQSVEHIDSAVEQRTASTPSQRGAHHPAPGRHRGALWGGNLCLSVMVFGWLPVVYGLGWWASVTAIVLGTLLGSLFVPRSALPRYRSGTNNSVTRGVVRRARPAGRLGDRAAALPGLRGFDRVDRRRGPSSPSRTASSGGWSPIRSTPLGYVVVALLIAAAAVYGFGWLVRISKLIVPVVLVTMVLMVVAFARRLRRVVRRHRPDAYAVGDFWPTWLWRCSARASPARCRT